MKRKLRSFYTVYIEGWYWTWGEYGGPVYTMFGLGLVTFVRYVPTGEWSIQANNEWLHWKVGQA